jgi:adenine C2-methylase RlmN of 23S rRNA A2503 and tRNA A37
MSETLFSIHDEEKIKSLLSKNGEPAFRYAQIENAIYKNFITDFEDISTISKKQKNF